LGYSDVVAEYDRIRAKNEAEMQRRRQEVYERLPALAEIRKQKEALQLQFLRDALDGKTSAADEIDALREKEKALLKKAGCAPDYLDPIYSCDICRDTGLREDTTRCECFKQRMLEDKLQAAKLTDSGISFAQFDLSIFSDEPVYDGKSHRDIMKKIKQHAEQYTIDYPHCEAFLILSGATGLGKTYISKCIQRAVIERGVTAAFYTAYRLFSMFHRHRLGEEIDLDPVFKVPLLIIDDIGTEPMTRNVTIEYFFDLINERNDAGLHTVIVTNLKLNAIKDRYGERIHSRLMDKYASKKILFNGADVRY